MKRRGDRALREFRTWWPEIAAGFILLAAFWPLQSVPLTHDIAWQLWIGRQMSHGVGLYSQIVELNPPLWFWMTIPIVRLAELVGASEFTGLVAFFILITGLTVCLLALLVREHPPQQRALMYATLGLVSVVLLLREFGQREQYVLLTTVPYLALIARRAAGLPTSVALAIGVAVFGASGFALKPYFVLTPIFLEAWFFLTARSNWRPWRPEWFVLVLGATGYGVAVVILTPAYLTATLPMTVLAYGAFDVPLYYLALSELALPAVLTLVGAILLGRLRSRVAAASLVAASAFVLAFILQGKVWFYHGIPAVGLMLFAVGSEAPLLPWREISFRQRVGLCVLAWAFFVPYFNSALLGFNVYHNRYRDEVLALTADLKPGQSVLPISARATFVWPMVAERGFLWPSRYYSFWMLPAIAQDRLSGLPNPKLARLAATVQAETLQDMRCNPPTRILVHATDREEREQQIFGLKHFDYLAFFKEDPGIAEMLTHYAPGPRGAWQTYDLVDPRGLKPPVGPCRRVY